MFLDEGNHEEIEVINFDEFEADHKIPNSQTNSYRPSSPQKITLNKEYHKNLGQNSASYADERKIDLNKISIENTKKSYRIAEIQEQIQQQGVEDDFGSVIQFQEIADKEEHEQQIRSKNSSENDHPPFSNENLGESRVQENNQISFQPLPQIQNSVVNNASAISAYPQVNKTIEFQLLREFLTSPLPEKGIVQCALIVNASGLNKLKPKFYLQKDGKIFLAAKKSSHKFIISMNKDKIARKSSNFIGQISCKQKFNYFFYDNGRNPKKNRLPVRVSMGTVKFIIPPKPQEPRQQEFQFPNDDSQVYLNRKPRWNEKSKSFTLNFYDRVKVSSIKNFQLIKQNELVEQIYVQLGKESDHKFNLDFQAPFSPLQAFMIALANYDKKIEY